MEKCSSLKKLDLSENKIGKSCGFLKRAFITNTTITEIDLINKFNMNFQKSNTNKDCEIENEGAKGIAKLLKGNSSITKLDLENRTYKQQDYN